MRIHSNTKQKLKIFVVIAITAAVTAGISYAAFGDKGKVLGSTFSVGSSDIKLLVDITQGAETSNLADEVNGPSFTNISPSWTQSYLVKFYNNSTADIVLTSHAKYSTANDPSSIRSYINVEPMEWNDSNNNGIVDTGEEGQSYGKKTIIKWSTEGFDLGQLAKGQIKPLILKFTAESITDTKQGQTGIFDFEFDVANL